MSGQKKIPKIWLVFTPKKTTAKTKSALKFKKENENDKKKIKDIRKKSALFFGLKFGGMRGKRGRDGFCFS